MNINGYEIAGRMPVFTPENRALVRSGAKTQTRRVMKNQPPTGLEFTGKETEVHFPEVK